MTTGLAKTLPPSSPPPSRAERRPQERPGSGAPGFELPPEASDRAVARRQDALARRDAKADDRAETRDAPPRRADPPRRTGRPDDAERAGRSDPPRVDKSEAPADPAASETAMPDQQDAAGEAAAETTSDGPVATGDSISRPSEDVLAEPGVAAPVSAAPTVEAAPAEGTGETGGAPGLAEKGMTAPEEPAPMPVTNAGLAAPPSTPTAGATTTNPPNGEPTLQEMRAAGASPVQTIPSGAAESAEAAAVPDPAKPASPAPQGGFAEHLKAEAPVETPDQIDRLKVADLAASGTSPQSGPGAQGLARAAAAAQTAASPPHVPVVSQVPLGAVPIEIGLKSLAGINRFEIRLDPAELGRIDVRLDIGEDGEVKAQLVVDRVETLALLQRDAKTLERAFEQAGLKPSEGGVDLSLRDPSGDGRFQQQNRDGREHEHGTGRPDRSAAPEGPEPSPVAHERARWRGTAGIDLRI